MILPPITSLGVLGLLDTGVQVKGSAASDFCIVLMRHLSSLILLYVVKETISPAYHTKPQMGTGLACEAHATKSKHFRSTEIPSIIFIKIM